MAWILWPCNKIGDSAIPYYRYDESRQISFLYLSQVSSYLIKLGHDIIVDPGSPFIKHGVDRSSRLVKSSSIHFVKPNTKILKLFRVFRFKVYGCLEVILSSKVNFLLDYFCCSGVRLSQHFVDIQTAETPRRCLVNEYSLTFSYCFVP